MSDSGSNSGGKARAKLHGMAALLLLTGAGFFMLTESIAGAVIGLALTAGAAIILFVASRRNRS